MCFFIAKLFRKKVILDVRDLWPESAKEVVQLKENILFKIIRYFVNIIYKYSNSVTVISQTMKNTIIDNYNIQNDKISVIHNFSNNKIFKGKVNSNNNIIIAYTGILTDAQDIFNILLILWFCLKGNRVISTFLKRLWGRARPLNYTFKEKNLFRFYFI